MSADMYTEPDKELLLAVAELSEAVQELQQRQIPDQSVMLRLELLRLAVPQVEHIGQALPVVKQWESYVLGIEALDALG